MSSLEFNPFSGTFDFIGGNKTLRGTLTPSETKTIQSTPISAFKDCTYFLRLYTANKSRNATFNVSYDSVKGVSDSMHGILGSSLSINIGASISGSNILFNLVNNESINLNYIIIKI